MTGFFYFFIFLDFLCGVQNFLISVATKTYVTTTKHIHKQTIKQKSRERDNFLIRQIQSLLYATLYFIVDLLTIKGYSVYYSYFHGRSLTYQNLGLVSMLFTIQ